MGNKLKLILFISIALNLLLVGLIIGYSTRGWVRHRDHYRPPPEVVQKLSPEKAEMFSKAMRSLHHKNRKTARKIRQVRHEVVEILTAPQFDAKAYQAKAEELHQLHGKMKGQLTETVMEVASQLDQADRQALAGFLAKGPPHHRRHRGRRGPGFGPRGRHERGPPPDERPPPWGPPPGGPEGEHQGPPSGPPPGDLD